MVRHGHPDVITDRDDDNFFQWIAQGKTSQYRLRMSRCMQTVCVFLLKYAWHHRASVGLLRFFPGTKTLLCDFSFHCSDAYWIFICLPCRRVHAKGAFRANSMKREIHVLSQNENTQNITVNLQITVKFRLVSFRKDFSSYGITKESHLSWLRIFLLFEVSVWAILIHAQSFLPVSKIININNDTKGLE